MFLRSCVLKPFIKLYSFYTDSLYILTKKCCTKFTYRNIMVTITYIEYYYVMSAQILELLLFAGVAFFIISRLIATLGSTSDDDPAKRTSFFGEAKGLKDVTNSVSQSFKELNKLTSDNSDIDDLITVENKDNIIHGLTDACSKMRNFSLTTFLSGAKSAFSMIIEANIDKNLGDIKALIDKRYIDQFSSIALSYGQIKNLKNLKAKVSDIYTFGNTVFIKVLFRGKNIVSNISNFSEEWTFSKSIINAGPEWYLTNIDRPQ